MRLVLRMAVPTAACRVLGSTVATRMHLHIVDIYDVFLWVGCMYAMIAGGLGAPIAAKSDKTFFFPSFFFPPVRSRGSVQLTSTILGCCVRCFSGFPVELGM